MSSLAGGSQNCFQLHQNPDIRSAIETQKVIFNNFAQGFYVLYVFGIWLAINVVSRKK